MDIITDIYEKLYTEPMSREGGVKRNISIKSLIDIDNYVKGSNISESVYMSHYSYITDVHQYKEENNKQYPPIVFDRVIFDFDIPLDEILKSEGYTSEEIYEKGKEILKNEGKNKPMKRDCIRKGQEHYKKTIENKESSEINYLTKDVTNYKEREKLIRDYYYKKYTSKEYLKKPYEEALKVGNFIKEQFQIEPLLFFSGGKGVHLYILFNRLDLPNTDQVVREFGLKLEEMFDLKTLDKKVIKSSSKRVIKIPCSMHHKTKLYAMPFNLRTSYFEMIDYAYESEPQVPLNVDNNTEIFESFLKNYSDHLLTINEEQKNSKKKSKYNDLEKNYTLNGDVFDLQEPFSRVYKQGNMNEIGHRLVHLFFKSKISKEDCVKFFETLEVEQDLNKVNSWINRVYDNPSDNMFIGNMGYFIQGVKEYCNPEDKDYVISKFKEYFEGGSYSKPTKSLYEPPKEYHDTILKEYRWDNEAFYCPIHTQDNKGFDEDMNVKGYFRIHRGSQYEISIGYLSKDGVFEAITQPYSSKKSLKVYDEKRNSKLGSWLKGKEFGHIKQDFELISITLGKVKDFSQITEDFKTYTPPTDEDSEEEVIDPETIIEDRRHPKLTEKQKKVAIRVREQIISMGFVNYISDILKDVYIGDIRNIMRKVLMSLTIMRGDGGFLSETTAEAGTGKSEEDKIVFEYIIPERYIMEFDDLTPPHFERFSETHTEFLDRTIFYMKDLGEEEAFNQVKKIFNIFKRLITEGRYKRGITEETSKGKHSQKDLFLKTQGFGVVYQTVTNSFSEGDSQLESRTLKSTITPDKETEQKILKFTFRLQYSNSPEAQKMREAIKNLNEFGVYLLDLVDKSVEIINPFESVFLKYSDMGNVPIRELKQQINLFKSYCILTLHKCDKVNGVYVASNEQLEEFMNNINLENALIPYENEFLKMLVGNDRTNNKLTLIDIDIDESEPDPLTPYFNNALEKTNTLDEYSPHSFDDLNQSEEKQFIKKLLKVYRLGGRSSDHKENVFFTITDIKRTFRKNKAFKNIKDLSGLLYTLHNRGYLGKLEFKRTNETIYYLTSKCDELDNNFDVKDINEEEVNNFLEDMGVI